MIDGTFLYKRGEYEMGSINNTELEGNVVRKCNRCDGVMNG